MELVTLDFLTSQLALADQLHAGKAMMFEPQDLPSRYGRVVKALDHVLEAIGCESVIGSHRIETRVPTTGYSATAICFACTIAAFS